jgi:hypothetical protein
VSCHPEVSLLFNTHVHERVPLLLSAFSPLKSKISSPCAASAAADFAGLSMHSSSALNPALPGTISVIADPECPALPACTCVQGAHFCGGFGKGDLSGLPRQR